MWKRCEASCKTSLWRWAHPMVFPFSFLSQLVPRGRRGWRWNEHKWMHTIYAAQVHAKQRTHHTRRCQPHKVTAGNLTFARVCRQAKWRSSWGVSRPKCPLMDSLLNRLATLSVVAAFVCPRDCFSAHPPWCTPLCFHTAPAPFRALDSWLSRTIFCWGS